jgi:UDP-2,4-diacetamido-2,4,6-trideoxy-beta-L-altropyranose hydrolase
MRVFFRADASIELGSGHIQRCLTLARVLAARGHSCTFLSRNEPGNLNAFVIAAGFPVVELPATTPFGWETDLQAMFAALADEAGDPEWLVVDHYRLDHRWESPARRRFRHVLAIDDLADRPHDCDLLLDQNLVPNLEGRYGALVPRQARTFLGPAYALLRPEFAEWSGKPRARDGSLQAAVVFFGGSDATGETEKVLTALESRIFRGIRFELIVGAQNPRRASIESRCQSPEDMRFHCQVPTMARLLWQADLAIGAGGASSWERCCLGLPALVTITADNQRDISLTLERHGAVTVLGEAAETTAATYENALRRVVAEPAALARMSIQARRVFPDPMPAAGAELVAAMESLV